MNKTISHNFNPRSQLFAFFFAATILQWDLISHVKFMWLFILSFTIFIIAVLHSQECGLRSWHKNLCLDQIQQRVDLTYWRFNYTDPDDLDDILSLVISLFNYNIIQLVPKSSQPNLEENDLFFKVLEISFFRRVKETWEMMYQVCYVDFMSQLFSFWLVI